MDLKSVTLKAIMLSALKVHLQHIGGFRKLSITFYLFGLKQFCKLQVVLSLSASFRHIKFVKFPYMMSQWRVV